MKKHFNKWHQFLNRTQQCDEEGRNCSFLCGSSVCGARCCCVCLKPLSHQAAFPLRLYHASIISLLNFPERCVVRSKGK